MTRLKVCKSLLFCAVCAVFAYALVIGAASAVNMDFNLVLTICLPLISIACACLVVFGVVADKRARLSRKPVRYVVYYQKPVVPGSKFAYVYEMEYYKKAS